MQIDVINPKKTALIVIDMQNDFVAPGAPLETPAARQIVPKLVEALKICREAGVKVIYTAHVHRRDGCDMGLFYDLHPPVANRDALGDIRRSDAGSGRNRDDGRVPLKVAFAPHYRSSAGRPTT